MSNTNTPIILIDGSSYLYRAFHALPSLTNSNGEPTGAIFGVLNMIRKLLAEYQPEYVGVVFDAKGKTRRTQWYPAYKANRPTMPEMLQSQIEPLHSAIRAMGLPLIMIEGVEADDIIATLTYQALEQQHSVMISTGDKDLAQLVNSKVSLINTMTDTRLDVPGVVAKFGVTPEQIIDYLALMGDTSDNIPGIPKIGAKTAVKLLNQYGNLSTIIQHADEIKGVVGENLRTHQDILSLSQRLVTLNHQEILPLSIADLKPNPPDSSALLALFKRLEFKNWLKELLEQNKNPSDESNPIYQTILTADDFLKLLNHLQQASSFVLDTETTSLNTLQAQLVGIAISVHGHPPAYIPLAHDYPGAPNQLNRDWVLNQLKPILENPEKTLIAQNIKYDLGVLANYGIHFTQNIRDTLLESYVLEGGQGRHNLDGLALKHLGKRAIAFEDIAGKSSKQLTFNQIPLEQAAPYAAQDADFTDQLDQILWSKITQTPNLQAILQNIEFPLAPVLSRMERLGVLINPQLLSEQSQQLGERLGILEQQAFQLAGGVFNLASPKQLQEILFTKLGLPVLEKTPTGAPSTAESVLQELAQEYPLPKVLLEHRSLSKLKSTYTDSLPKQIDPLSERIHTSYNQAVTSTGRLSSTDPNLQNIPIRHEAGRQVRRAFIAPPGYRILSADYSQIELRIMAHLSQDPGLLTAFANDRDIHAATASEIFGLPLDQVTQEHRRHAKAINFGLLYGMSAFGLSKQIQVTRDIAQAYIDQYFLRYPKVKQYMEQMRTLAHETGYVETLLGRRLYIPDIRSSQGLRRRAAERAAINAPMQGTAADIIKIAMIALDKTIQSSTMDVKMIMQVHDELVFEVADSMIDAAKTMIEQHMTAAVSLSVPLLVNIGVGSNWEEAH